MKAQSAAPLFAVTFDPHPSLLPPNSPLTQDVPSVSAYIHIHTHTRVVEEIQGVFDFVAPVL